MMDISNYKAQSCQWYSHIIMIVIVRNKMVFVGVYKESKINLTV